MHTTTDTLLGGQIHFEQPAQGYRSAIDPILLAAAAPPVKPDPVKSDKTVLDLGAGAGAALLCFLFHNPTASGVGIEQDSALVDLLTKNIQRNFWQDRATAVKGNIKTGIKISDLPFAAYDRVLINPPYYQDHRHDLSPDPDRRQAMSESTATLQDFVAYGLRRLRPRGWISLILPPARLTEALIFLAEKTGDIQLLPIFPHEGKPANRLLINARKGSKGATVLHSGLILHQKTESQENQNTYTPQAQAILQGRTRWG